MVWKSKSMDWFLYDNGLRFERVKMKSFWQTKWITFVHFLKINIWVVFVWPYFLSYQSFLHFEPILLLKVHFSQHLVS